MSNEIAEEILDLKDRVVKAEKNRDQAEGAKKQILVDLEKKHGVKSKEEAEKKLDKLSEERTKLHKEAGERMDAFNEKYPDL